MILENYNDPNSPVITNDKDYASLLVADYHNEYPLEGPARIQLLFDPFNFLDLIKRLNPDNGVADQVERVIRSALSPLETKYGGFYDLNMTLWRVEGTRGQIMSVFDNLAQSLMGGPQGADDDTYDYWPNAYDMLIALAHDLIDLDASRTSWISTTIDRVVNSAIALNGPLADWEAEEIAVQAASIKRRVNHA